jgi:hypothetical protein
MVNELSPFTAGNPGNLLLAGNTFALGEFFPHQEWKVPGYPEIPAKRYQRLFEFFNKKFID